MSVTNSDEIRMLNDRFRQSFQGGSVLMTRGHAPTLHKKREKPSKSGGMDNRASLGVRLAPRRVSVRRTRRPVPRTLILPQQAPAMRLG